MGVQLFSGGGGNCLFPIETHISISCDFPGGPDPISLYLEVHVFFWILLMLSRICAGSPEEMQQAEKSHDIVQS